MNISLSDPIVQGVMVAFIGGILVTLFILLLRQLKKYGYQMFLLFRRGARKKTGLECYRKTLEEKTMHITHPWMKEGQTLTDILVPINFDTGKGSHRQELEVYLSRKFQQDPSLRLLILGKPGSGKTIAMRVMARALWSYEKEVRPVPVLMNFSDIKGITDHKGLEQKIVETLKLYQFEKGNKHDHAAESFVEENLYTGKLFLLFDGFDELDKPSREAAARLLNTFLGTHSQVPAAISCRTALYESELAFDSLRPDKIKMAPFTPFAILKFLSLWQFEGKKSSHELYRMIHDRAHLSELAANPLMLTIITFLYSLPKYTLPDNRVEFYEQCSRALLEEWDRAQQRDRANRFESHQKLAVLNRLALEHISSAGRDDELIAEQVIHRVVRQEMGRLGLKAEEYPRMEKEIVLNSGLLQYIPATDYRFPHRTFMEFFAASGNIF
jgi:predicted NACHT family NTPase